MNSLEAMKQRKSTRTFQDTPLELSVNEKIEEIIKKVAKDTPWGSDLRFGYIPLKNGVVSHSGDKIGTYGVVKNQQGYIYGVCPKTVEGINDFSYGYSSSPVKVQEKATDLNLP